MKKKEMSNITRVVVDATLSVCNSYAIDSLFEKGCQGRFDGKPGIKDVAGRVTMLPGFVFTITQALKGSEGAGSSRGGVECDKRSTSEGSLSFHLGDDREPDTE